MNASTCFIRRTVMPIACALLTALGTTLAQGACTPPPSGIVGWWPGQGNTTDIIGGDNGTLSSTGASYATAEVGQGFRFDGTNGYVSIPDSAALKPTNVTLEAWVWLDPAIPSNRGPEAIIFKQNTWTYYFEGYALSKDTTGSPGSYSDHFSFVVSRNGNQVIIESPSIAQRGVWYHVAATYDGNQSTLYVNGVAVGSATPGFPLDYGTEPIFIGTTGTPAPYQAMFGGIIDEPSIYNRVLSSNQIAAIYQAGSAGKCVSLVVSPTITNQPASVTLQASNTATFSVGATGTAPLSYQWSVNNAPIAGATNNILSVPNVQLAQNGNVYFVVVSNLAGSVTSSNALLTVTSPTPPSCTTAPSGLVSWWPAEGNANDIIGGNNGTVNGALGYANGEVGHAFVFDDSTSYISVPASPSVNIGATGSGLTIECWIKPDSFDTAVSGAPIAEWDSPSTDGLQFWSGGALYANLVDTTGAYHQLQSVAGLPVSNVWQHVALTYDKASGKAVIYWNGTVVATNNLGTFTPQTTYPLNIGRRTGQPIGLNDTYGGLMDELSLYNRALSSNEVYTIYAAGSAGKCNASGPVVTAVPAIYNFSPASGTNGAVVAIIGTNFNSTASSNIVYFGAVQANVLVATPTSLIVTVPTGATYAPITETVGGLTAYSGRSFEPTFIGGGTGITTSSFAPSFTMPTLNGPAQTAIADLDGDGKPDVIVADVYQNAISIFRNISTNGTLTANSFAQRLDLPATGGTYSPNFITVADVDGDGKLDIIATEYGDNLVSVYRNISTPGNLAFAPRVDFATGTQPQGAAVADLDGDGRPDILVANIGDGSVSILRNTGSPGILNSNSFAPKVDIATGAGADRVAVGDLNGDGRPDVAVANDNAGTISVLQNLITTPGSITAASFAPKIDLSVPSGSISVAMVDIDGDGKLDLAVTAYLPQIFSVFQNLNNGGNLTSNSFGPRIDYNLNGRGHTIAVGDINGDGKPDLVVDTELNSIVNVFQNLSTPGTLTSSSLATQVELSTGWNAWGISVGDLDGDGRPDLVFANSYDNNIQIYQNQSPFAGGSSGGTPPAGPPVITSISPVVGTNGAVITLTGTNFNPTASSNIVYFGAVRGNVVGATLTSIQVTVPPGATFGPLTVSVNGLTAASPQLFEPTFNGLSTYGPISNASFPASFTLPGFNGPQSMVIADFDGDGKPDIAFANGYGNIVSLYQNIGTNGQPLSANSFGPRIDIPTTTGGTAGFLYRLKAVDVDGDGRLDLIGAEVNGNRIDVFPNLSTPGILNSNSFGPSFPLISGNDCRNVAAADLDGDGRVDLVGLNFADNTLSLFKNIGTAGNLSSNSFAAPVTLPNPGGPYDIAIVDLNGDGKPDIATVDSNSNSISVFQNQTVPGVINSNSFTSPVSFACGTEPQAIVAVDLDGDGLPDLAVGCVQADAVQIFRNLNTGGPITSNSLAAPVSFGTPGWMHSISVADFNGDGKPDLAVCGELNSYMSIFQNTSTPGSFTSSSFGPRVDFSTGWNAWGIAAGDLDGDGRPDIIFANYYDNNIQIYQNQIPFQTPAPPSITGQSPSEYVLLGGSVTFSVTAAGSPPLSYSWFRNSVVIPGATNTTYTLYNAQLSDSGSKFSCLVTNAYGSVASTNVSIKVIDTISNDLCSGAVIITSSNYTNEQSTLTASSYGDPVPDCIDGFGNGVWYQFTPPVSGLLEVDTFGSDFDTGLAIYTGSCDSLAEVDCNDDFNGVTSELEIPVTAGTTYYFLAGGYAGHTGDLTFHLNFYTPPAFPVQPANLSVVVTSNATINATVSGSPPISLQWYFNNAPLTDGGRISGSVSPVLNIANIGGGDGGNYYLVASNFVGVTTSSVAVLTPVYLPPFVITAPVGQSVIQGSNVTFSAVVGGSMPFNYQWSLNGNPLTDDGVHVAGSGTASLSISNLTTADAGSYTLTVTNLGGSTNTSATLIVMVPPTIATPPLGRSVPPGLPTTFSASATGIPAPNLQWLLNGASIPGATATSYTVPSVGSANLGAYQIVASNSVGSVTSVVAQLTYGPVAAWGRNSANESLPPPGLSNVVSVAGTFGASFAVRRDGSIVPWGGNVPATNIPTAASNVVAMATYGAGPSVALRSDGKIVGWYGSFVPTTISNVVAVALGNEFGMALRAEGIVIGFGNLPYSTVPAGLINVQGIACGNTFTLALKNDGTITAWGSGPGTNVPAGLSGITSIAAGSSHGLALRTNGTVVAWGSGAGTNNMPSQASGLTNITAISASSYPDGSTVCLALRADGIVFSWGNNNYGEATPPGALNSLTSVAVSAAAFHSLAIVNDGTPQFTQEPVGLSTYVGRNVTLQASAVGAAPLTYQWLVNGLAIPGATNNVLSLPNIQIANAGAYQLFISNSIGTALSLSAPVNVFSNSPLVLLTQSSATATNIYQAGKATLTAGAVLGSGPITYQWFFSPTNRNYVPVPGGTNTSLTFDPALAVQTGNYYVAISNTVSGLTNNPINLKVAFARAWGAVGVSNVPVNVTNAIAAATGGTIQSTSAHYLVLGSDGKVTSWANGLVNYGETNVAALSNSIVTAVAAGYQSSLALKSDGTVYAWGYGGYGQTNVPANLNNVVAISVGGYHDLALKGDGTVVGWGDSSVQIPFYGQTTNNPAATNVVAIAAGGQFSLALRQDGSVVSWGYIGNGINQIPITATNIVAIAAGTDFGLGLRGNGTVVQWGNGLINYPTPLNLSNIVAISASGTHALALKNNGTVVTWGNAYTGVASNNLPADLTNVVALASGGDHDIALFGTRAPVFTVQPWSRTVTLSKTAVIRVSITAKCAGVQPMSYQWLQNGTNYPGATSDTLVITNDPNGTHLPTGAFQLVASNSYGVTVSKPAKVTVFIPLNDAVDATNLVWTTSGAAQWYGQNVYTHDGVDAARSGGIGGSQETILQTTLVTNFAGQATFWWKVSSEQFFDTLEFRVNGNVMGSISGEQDWTQASFPVPPGTNVLMWRYSKDPTFDSGLDAGFVDQFAFVAGPPVIMAQPASVITNIGATVTLSVVASGVPQLRYQWLKDGNPIGNNGSTLPLINVNRSTSGSYCVTVTNSGGSVTSSTAVVQVNAPQILGSPQLLPDGSLSLTSADAHGDPITSADLTNFEAQASTDLVNWVTLPGALSIVNGQLVLQDTGTTNYTTRFYRIIEH